MAFLFLFMCGRTLCAAWCWCTAVLSLGLYPNQIGTDLDCCLSLPTRWLGYGLPTTSGNNELMRLALLKLVYVNCEFIWSLDNLAIGRARFFAIWILQSIFFSFCDARSILCGLRNFRNISGNFAGILIILGVLCNGLWSGDCERDGSVTIVI